MVAGVVALPGTPCSSFLPADLRCDSVLFHLLPQVGELGRRFAGCLSFFSRHCDSSVCLIPVGDRMGEATKNSKPGLSGCPYESPQEFNLDLHSIQNTVIQHRLGILLLSNDQRFS